MLNIVVTEGPQTDKTSLRFVVCLLVCLSQPHPSSLFWFHSSAAAWLTNCSWWGNIGVTVPTPRCLHKVLFWMFSLTSSRRVGFLKKRRNSLPWMAASASPLPGSETWSRQVNRNCMREWGEGLNHVDWLEGEMGRVWERDTKKGKHTRGKERVMGFFLHCCSIPLFFQLKTIATLCRCEGAGGRCLCFP